MSYFKACLSCNGALSWAMACMPVTVNAFSAGIKRKLTRRSRMWQSIALG